MNASELIQQLSVLNDYVVLFDEICHTVQARLAELDASEYKTFLKLFFQECAYKPACKEEQLSPETLQTVESGDYASLSGNEWRLLLQERPELADRCDWEKLNEYEWCCLLAKQPQFFERYPRLYWPDHKCWMQALCRYPQLASLYDRVLEAINSNDLFASLPSMKPLNRWEYFSGEMWRELLSCQPQFYDRCENWSLLTHEDWLKLLYQHPLLICKCDLARLSEEELSEFIRSFCDPTYPPVWQCLLVDYELSKRKLTKLSSWEWVEVLTTDLPTALLIWDQCPWHKFTNEEWDRILEIQSLFADRCNNWNQLSCRSWSLILAARPELAYRCNKWKEFADWDWNVLLQRQPQFVDRCDKWSEFSSQWWRALLEEQPQFADQCDKWHEFTSRDWSFLLTRQPHTCPNNFQNGVIF